MFQEWHSAIPLHGFRLDVALPSTKDSKIVVFHSLKLIGNSFFALNQFSLDVSVITSISLDPRQNVIREYYW